ncbi:hypothetical protein [Sinorhizobium meliloti]
MFAVILLVPAGEVFETCEVISAAEDPERRRVDFRDRDVKM